MPRKLHYLLALPALILSLFSSTPVAALEAGDLVMSISPSEQVIELAPGEHYSGRVTVTNVGRLPFDFILEAAPYHVNDDTYDPDFSTDSSYINLKNWLSFPESSYHLDPGQSIDAKFDVDVPADAPNGGQYAAIMIQNSASKPNSDVNKPAADASKPTTDAADPSTTNPDNLDDKPDSDNADSTDDDAAPDSPLELRVRAAAVLYGHVSGGELRESANLVTHSLPGLVLGDTLSGVSTIKNDGNVDFYARQTLSIRNFFTNNEVLQPTADGEPGPFTETLIVLPGTSRTSILSWRLADTGTFPIGLYRVTQTIVFLDQTHTFERLVFICPIWLALLVLFLVVLAAVWLILTLLKRRKNHRQNSTF